MLLHIKNKNDKISCKILFNIWISTDNNEILDVLNLFWQIQTKIFSEF